MNYALKLGYIACICTLTLHALFIFSLFFVHFDVSTLSIEKETQREITPRVFEDAYQESIVREQEIRHFLYQLDQLQPEKLIVEVLPEVGVEKDLETTEFEEIDVKQQEELLTDVSQENEYLESTMDKIRAIEGNITPLEELGEKGIQVGVEHASRKEVENGTILSDEDSFWKIDEKEWKTFLFEESTYEMTPSIEKGVSEKIGSNARFYIQVQQGSVRGKRIFTIDLIPLKRKETSLTPSIEWLFLIDRSHSIAKERFDLAKQGVKQALDVLSEQDYFQIILFDHSLKTFKPEFQVASSKNKKEAAFFLDQERYGGMFALTDLMTPLQRSLQEHARGKNIKFTVLISDGDTYLKNREMREKLKKFTTDNRGKTTLFTIPSGIDNHLHLLDLLSRFNRGRLFSEGQGKNLQDFIVESITRIRHPLSEDLKLTPLSERETVKLYPNQYALPIIFEDVPLHLAGESEESEFYLLITGNLQGEWVEYQEKIDLTQAHEMPIQELEKRVEFMKSYERYYQAIQ